MTFIELSESPFTDPVLPELPNSSMNIMMIATRMTRKSNQFQLSVQAKIEWIR